MAEQFYLGYDFGGTQARAVVSGSDGEFSEENVIVEGGNRDSGPMGVSNQLISAGIKAIEKRGIGISDISGIGVCSAGPLDMDLFGGSILNSPNIRFPQEREAIRTALRISSAPFPSGFKYKGVPLIEKNERRPGLVDRIIPMVQPLKEKFGVPVNLGNDVNVATIGIVVFGEGAKYGNPDDVNYTGVGVTHGTGYGVGVWSRRGIVWGVDGNAAEGGHFRIDKDGARCGCGNYGCAETLGSGSGSAWRARELLVRNRFDSEIFERARDASKAHSKRDINMNPYLILGDVDSKLVFEVYEDNPEDRVAGQVVREVGKAIGRSYGIIAGAYNTSFIANFGSMTNDWGHLEDIVMDELKASCNVRVPDVFTTKLGSNVGLKGALGYAMGKGE